MTASPVHPDGKPDPAARARKAFDATYNEAALKGRLSDEYKILQDKIDKIGGFRFTIKGWSVTAVIAASAAASTSGRLVTVLTVSLGLALMLGFFFWLEFDQVRLSWLFGDRAIRLEDAFRQVDRGNGTDVHATFRVPYMAHESVLAGHRRKVLPERGRGPKSSEARKPSRWAERWQISKKADILFYLMFTVLAFVPLVPHYRAILKHYTELKAKVFHSQGSTVGGPTISLPSIERKYRTW